ncbi:MAG: tyrosine-type recombinase/integrase [Geminicoccaceae bacterium]
MPSSDSAPERKRRKQRGLPRYWRVRRSAAGALSYWHEPAARDRQAFPTIRLPIDRALWGTADEKRQALLDCEVRNAELDAWRAGLRGAVGEKHRPGTFAALVDRYRKSDRWRELAPRTRKDYERHLTELMKPFGAQLVAGFTPRAVAAYRATLKPGRQGNMRLQVLSLLLSYAREQGLVADNPALRHRRFKLTKREAYWSDEAIATFMASDKASPAMRLALMLGLWTGQREDDVLHMRWSDIKDGWLTIRQRKVGKLVSLPIGAPLAAYLGDVAKAGIVILLGERGAPFTTNWFSQSFGRAARACGLVGLTFLDTRRTAVVNLAEAGCTTGEIASITGHSIAETQRILDTYWVASRPQAEAAISKLVRADRRKTAKAKKAAATAEAGARVRARTKTESASHGDD